MNCEPSRREQVPLDIMAAFLMADPAQDCPFLDRATGCRIHDRKPQTCRELDCRELAQVYSRESGVISPAVWDRGQELRGS